MEKLQVKGFYKLICVYLSVLLLMTGLSSGYAEKDSFFSCLQSYVNDAAFERTSGAIERVEVCNLKTLERQDARTGVSDTRRLVRRGSFREGLLLYAGITLFLNNAETYHDGIWNTSKSIGHKIILEYIHSQDGEK